MRTVGFLQKIQSEPPGADTWHVTVGADITTTSAHFSQIFFTVGACNTRANGKKNLNSCADVVVTSAQPRARAQSKFALGPARARGTSSLPGLGWSRWSGLGLTPAFCLGQPEGMEMA
ncbi:hypothetical protein L3X38_030621 [Prunus dulcis]|uniref:Uncharacterized protein n=1 Tax=Prunus dulcis TaxID=3755 RepID=A0AAD4YU65_PRUDU|nr:hypothetical protein L3X38_030621 [Prunus dulcis]